MSAYGIGLDEIMDAFGIEKEVDLSAKSSAVGGVSDGQKSKITTDDLGDLTVTQGKSLTTGKVTIKAKVDGVVQDLPFDLDLSALTSGNGNIAKATLADEVAKQLNANEDFSKNFTASSATGKLTFEAKENGGNIILGSSTPAAGDFKITFAATAAGNQTPDAQTKGSAQANDQVKGHYGEIDLDNLKDGDTITIAGKTYTKVADDTAVKDTYAGFKMLMDLKNC